MRPNRSITISLPEDMVELVEKKIASGEFANESEVVAEGLRYLADNDAEIEQWIRDEVVPALEVHDADPSKAKSAEETRQELHEYIHGLARRKSQWG
ncbi:type II toxin-antitoxin system ParD family antitoxin [Rhizobium sp. XQZ8]|uniref:ribbon-helix-helix domain-containing protein n=1 Tax=Rhizobium populisoli TaxID=2859785 RepID=UPI001CA4CE61|nr:type II toxin-antitoxin system ParD family antitoxin [Rhizobium populisoli]MBW6421155.1 type II toxin-antitoxin system ParD family antitoxin [Rhizobium populisoli]